MRFSLYTRFDEPYRPVAELTIPVLKEYCEKWGNFLSVKENPLYEKGIIWGRIEDMLTSDTGADWLVHIDADVLITNLTISLESIVDGVEQDIIVGSDQNGINDGMLFVRDTPQARELIYQLYRKDKDCFQSQLAHDIEAVGHRVKIASQRQFNSYLRGEYADMPEGCQWEERDFALHCPGRTPERRVEILQQIIPLIQR